MFERTPVESLGRHEDPIARDRNAVEHLDHLAAVDRVVRSLTHAQVRERPAHEVQEIRPSVRIHVGDDVHPGGLEAVDGIGRWCLDPIDLPGQQRRDTRRRLRHRQQHDAVLLGNAVVVPVIGVLDELEPLVRHHLVELIGARSSRRFGIGLIVVPCLRHCARRHHQQERQVIGKQRDDGVGMDRNRGAVDLLDMVNVVAAGARAGEVQGIEGRTRLRRQPFEVPNRGIGIPIAAVVEFDVMAQFDNPFLWIVGIGRPLRRQRGPDVGLLVVARQIPVDKPVIEVEPDEPIAFETLIGLSGPVGNVAGCHSNAQNRLRGGRFRLECQCARRHQQRNQNRGKGLVQIEHYEHLSALNCV